MPGIMCRACLVGSLGLLIELYNPGLIFPGVVGAIALLLALYSLQTLPVNYTGLLLLGLAVIMFILEIKVTSFGMLTVGGIVAMLLGSLMLIDSPEEYLRIPLTTIIVVVGTTAALFTVIIGTGARSMRRRPVSGREGMQGAVGKALTSLEPQGTVFVQGTRWNAQSTNPIAAGETIRVVQVEGLTLTVEKV